MATPQLKACNQPSNFYHIQLFQKFSPTQTIVVQLLNKRQKQNITTYIKVWIVVIELRSIARSEAIKMVSKTIIDWMNRTVFTPLSVLIILLSCPGFQFKSTLQFLCCLFPLCMGSTVSLITWQMNIKDKLCSLFVAYFHFVYD